MQIKYILLLTGIASLLQTCGPELLEVSSVPPPSVTNGIINAETLEISGEVISIGDGIVDHGHVWSIDGSTPIIEDAKYSRTNLGILKAPATFTSVIPNLVPGAQYFIRAFAEDVHGQIYYDLNNTIEYTVPSGISIGLDSIMSEVYIQTSNNYTITVTGELKNLGNLEIVELGLERSTDPSFSSSIIQVGANQLIQNGNFSAELDKILPGTVYYLRPFVKDQTGERHLGTAITYELKDAWLKVMTEGLIPATREGGVAVDGKTKGYFGFGTNHNDFYNYDADKQEWQLVQMTGYSGERWDGMVAYSNPTIFIGEVGEIIYLCTGWGPGFLRQEVWDYSSFTQSWNNFSYNLGFSPRYEALGIDYKDGSGLIVGGLSQGDSVKTDAWIHNRGNLEMQAADFPGGYRYLMTGFMIDNEAFVGGGFGTTTPLASETFGCTLNDCLYDQIRLDFWRYNRNQNQWTQLPSIPRDQSISEYAQLALKFGFALDKEGYILLFPFNRQTSVPETPQLLSFNPAQNQWTRKKDLPFNKVVLGEFVINEVAYLLVDEVGRVEIWQYFP